MADYEQEINNLVQSALVPTCDDSLGHASSGNGHGSWFDELSKENEDLKKTNKDLNQKCINQTSKLANYEEKLAVSIKDVFSIKVELDQLKKKNEENETDNSNLKLRIQELEFEVNQYKNIKLIKELEDKKFPELEEMLKLKMKNIKRYKKNAVSYRAQITEKDNMIKRMKCHIKNIWDMIIDIGEKSGRAGILSEKQKKNILREYEEEYLSLKIVEDEEGKNICKILKGLPTPFELPDTSTRCIEKIKDMYTKEELITTSIYSSPTLLSTDEVTSSDDIHADSLRNKLLKHPLIKQAKAKKSFSKKLKPSLPLEKYEKNLISCPSPDTLSSDKEREPHFDKQSETVTYWLTRDFETSGKRSSEIIERPLTTNNSVVLNELDFCLQTKSCSKDSMINASENNTQIPNTSMPLLKISNISNENVGDISKSEDMGPFKNVCDTKQQEFSWGKEIHKEIKGRNVSNEIHKEVDMTFVNDVCNVPDLEMTSSPEKIFSDVSQSDDDDKKISNPVDTNCSQLHNDLNISDDDGEKLSNPNDINCNLLHNDLNTSDDDGEKISNPSDINCNLLQNDLNISDDDGEKISNPGNTNYGLLHNDLHISDEDLNLSDDDILKKFKETLNTLDKLPISISPLPPTPPKIKKIIKNPKPLPYDLEKTAEILQTGHISSDKKTIGISSENICSDFDKENTSDSLKSSLSSKKLDFYFSNNTIYSPEKLTNNNGLFHGRNLPTYSHNGVCSGLGKDYHNTFSETSLNLSDSDSFTLQRKNLCSVSIFGSEESLSSQHSYISPNVCQDFLFKKQANYGKKERNSKNSHLSVPSISQSHNLNDVEQDNVKIASVVDHSTESRYSVSKSENKDKTLLTSKILPVCTDSVSSVSTVNVCSSVLNNMKSLSDTKASLNKVSKKCNPLSLKCSEDISLKLNFNESESVNSTLNLNKRKMPCKYDSLVSNVSENTVNLFNDSYSLSSELQDELKLNREINEDNSNRIGPSISKKQKISNRNLCAGIKESSVSDSNSNNVSGHFPFDKQTSSQASKDNLDIVSKDIDHTIHVKNSKKNNLISSKDSSKDNSNILQKFNQNIHEPHCISELEKDSFNKKISFEHIGRNVIERVGKISTLKDSDQNTSNGKLAGIKDLVEPSEKDELKVSSIKNKEPECSNFIVPEETLGVGLHYKLNGDSNKSVHSGTCIKNSLEESLKPSSEVELQTSLVIEEIPKSLCTTIPLKKVCNKLSKRNSSSKRNTILLPGPSMPSNWTKSRIINNRSLSAAKEEIKSQKHIKEFNNSEPQKKPPIAKKTQLNVSDSFKKKIKNTGSEFVAPVRIRGRTFQSRTFIKKSGNDDITTMEVEKHSIDCNKTEDIKCPTLTVSEDINTEYLVNVKSTKIRKEHKKKNYSMNTLNSRTANSNSSDVEVELKSSVIEEKLLPAEEVILKNPLDLSLEVNNETKLSAIKNQSSLKHKLKTKKCVDKQNIKCPSNCSEKIMERLQSEEPSKKVIKQNYVLNDQSKILLLSNSEKLILNDVEQTTSEQNKTYLGEKRKFRTSLKKVSMSRKKPTLQKCGYNVENVLETQLKSNNSINNVLEIGESISISKSLNEGEELCFNNSNDYQKFVENQELSCKTPKLFDNSIEKEICTMELMKSKLECFNLLADNYTFVKDSSQICVGKNISFNEKSSICTISDRDNFTGSVVNSQDNSISTSLSETSKSMNNSNKIPKDAKERKSMEFMKKRESFRKINKVFKKINKDLKDNKSEVNLSTNPIQDILRGIENTHSIDEHFKNYVRTLTNYLINPANASDATAIIFHVLNYLHHTRENHLLKFTENREQCEILPCAENCIVMTLFKIEKMAKPYLHKLIQKTLNVTYQLVLSKKKFNIYGLASFCRVLTEICKCNGDKLLPLNLCCDLLKAKHLFSPYLVASIIGVWKEPFEISDNFSGEEMALLGAIAFGTKNYTKKLNRINKDCCLKFLSDYFTVQSVPDVKKVIEFLMERILLKCLENSFDNIWKLTSPLVILSAREDWVWVKKHVFDDYIILNLQRFSSQNLNEHAFDLYCDLYVDVIRLSPVYLPEKVLIGLFEKQTFNKDDIFIQDSTAIALMKYVLLAKREVHVSVLKWFQMNQDNPKVVKFENVYRRRLISDVSECLSIEDIVVI
ncbi:uncharacterized protein NPIL_597221 [Nephila pilipes]|uniref:Uncharacterized protein n=1 Tax=Nephila pilipes TaxID=299642 RepID=A0A8X6Q559_NEPPI|nr:uncharacterized protein NPIL_597221 [Nephila pilipes]